MMSIGRLVSQALAGVAMSLAVGAVLCESAGEARAAAKTACNCTSDSCSFLPGGGCCNGFCTCVDNCGCATLINPDTGLKYPRCAM